MPKATIQDTIIAETENIESIEGNTYFPADSVKKEFFSPSSTTTFCPWKGDAHYYDIQVKDTIIKDGAWYYPDPKPEASHIKDFVAFYTSKGIDVA